MTAGSNLYLAATGGYNHFNLGVGRDGDGAVTTKTLAELATYSESPYFSLDDTGVWTNFGVRLDAVTTEGSDYPRSELRELAEDGTTLLGFNPTTGTNEMSGTTIIDVLARYKKAMVIGQMHDTVSDSIMIASQNVDSAPYPLDGQVKIVIRINGGAGAGGISLTAIPIYEIGTPIPWKMRCGSFGWEVYIGDMTTPFATSVTTGTALTASGLCYFKAGCYSNTNATVESDGGGSPSTFYVKCRLRALRHTHTSWTTPVVQTSGVNFSPSDGAVDTPRFGAKSVSVNTGGDGTNPLTFTPAWPTPGPDAGDLVACIIWIWRTHATQTPSTPNIASGWTSKISDSLQTGAHGIRNRIYYTRATAGMAAPGVLYTAATPTDFIGIQLLVIPGALASGDPTDQISALTQSAAASTTVIGPAPAPGATIPPGSLELALIGHEYARPSGTITTVTGTDSPTLTWAEALEHIGTSPAGPTLAHDWALVPSVTTVAAKQATGTAGTSGRGMGRSWSILPEPARSHGIINACAGSA